MGDGVPTVEGLKLQHDFRQDIKYGVIPTYQQDTWLCELHGPDKLVGHIGACLEEGRLVIGEGPNIVTVNEAYRDVGIASKMFGAFILNVWDVLPDQIRMKLNVIMRNGEAGNERLLAWLNSLGVDSRLVSNYTHLSNDRFAASKTEAEDEVYLQISLRYLQELFS